MIRWHLHRRHGARPIEPSRMVSPRRAELETAKEILEEIFGVRTVEVDEMILSRMEERSWDAERTHLSGKRTVAGDVLPGGVAMGRSFESMRMSAKDVSARRLKASKALKKEGQVYGQRLAEMAERHSGEAFYALDDPLEAAVFSVLVEMMKKRVAGEYESKEIEIE